MIILKVYAHNRSHSINHLSKIFQISLCIMHIYTHFLACELYYLHSPTIRSQKVLIFSVTLLTHTFHHCPFLTNIHFNKKKKSFSRKTDSRKGFKSFNHSIFLKFIQDNHLNHLLKISL